MAIHSWLCFWASYQGGAALSCAWARYPYCSATAYPANLPVPLLGPTGGGGGQAGSSNPVSNEEERSGHFSLIPKEDPKSAPAPDPPTYQPTLPLL